MEFTGAVPCDSLTATCPYDPDMAVADVVRQGLLLQLQGGEIGVGDLPLGVDEQSRSGPQSGPGGRAGDAAMMILRLETYDGETCQLPTLLRWSPVSPPYRPPGR